MKKWRSTTQVQEQTSPWFLSPLKLLPSWIRAVILPCTSHTACQVHFPRLWITGVGRSPTENSNFHPRKKIPLNWGTQHKQFLFQLATIFRNYCAKLIMLSNTSYAHSLSSGQSDLMLQHTWISKVFWEINLNSIFHVPLNGLGTQYIYDLNHKNTEILACLLWELSPVQP